MKRQKEENSKKRVGEMVSTAGKVLLVIAIAVGLEVISRMRQDEMLEQVPVLEQSALVVGEQFSPELMALMALLTELQGQVPPVLQDFYMEVLRANSSATLTLARLFDVAASSYREAHSGGGSEDLAEVLLWFYTSSLDDRTISLVPLTQVGLVDGFGRAYVRPLLELAALQGSEEATGRLLAHYFQLGVAERPQLVQFLWLAAERESNVIARTALARVYGKVDGQAEFEYPPANATLAVELLEPLMEQPLAEVHLLMGFLLFSQRDFPAAYDRFKTAAGFGDTISCRNIGILIINDLLADKSPDEAVFYFTRAAQHGDLESRRFLARLHFQGRYVVQNSSMAVAWLQQNIDAGDPAAAFDLAVVLISGLHNVPQDAPAGCQLALQSARKDHRQAFPLAASCLLATEEMTQAQKEEAVAYLQECALLGSVQCWQQLGAVFGSSDPLQALAAYREAILRDPADSDSTEKFLSLLAFAQIEDFVDVFHVSQQAQRWLGRTLVRLHALGPLAAAVDMLRVMESVATPASPEALYWLGLLRHEGVGFPADRAAGVALILEAANRGSDLAATTFYGVGRVVGGWEDLDDSVFCHVMPLSDPLPVDFDPELPAPPQPGIHFFTWDIGDERHDCFRTANKMLNAVVSPDPEIFGVARAGLGILSTPEHWAANFPEEEGGPTQ